MLKSSYSLFCIVLLSFALGHVVTAEEFPSSDEATGNPVAAERTSTTVTEQKAVELSTSLNQLREQLANADAATTAQALGQWAAQHRTELAASKVRLEHQTQVRGTQNRAESRLTAPQFEAAMTEEEQQLATLRYELAVSKQAALDAVPDDDAKARRDAEALWYHQNKTEVQRTNELEDMLSVSDRIDGLVKRKEELAVQAALTEQEHIAQHPGLSRKEYQLIALRKQWEYRKVAFEQSHANNDSKAYRDAYARFCLENQSLCDQIAVLEAGVKAAAADTTLEALPSENELSALSGTERTRYEARCLWEVGRQRVIDENPDASPKQLRDLMARYDMQTRALQVLFR